MESAFWIERWENNQIGFHKNEFNPLLLKYSSDLIITPNQRVLVPLCGKTLDLVWWKNQGLHVTGVELSDLACEAFFKEQKIHYQKQNTFYQSESISIYQGDFFEFKAVSPFDIIYDRAATIALPLDMRRRYYLHLKNLLHPKHGQLFLITIEYDQAKVGGPPFHVSDLEIREAFKEFKIKNLQNAKTQLDNPRFQDIEVKENVYLITPS